MSQQFDPTSFTAAHAADPNTPVEILAAIANQRPDLRAALASNPAAPQDLLQWLGATGDPQVAQALAQRQSATPSPAEHAATASQIPPSASEVPAHEATATPPPVAAHAARAVPDPSAQVNTQPPQPVEPPQPSGQEWNQPGQVTQPTYSADGSGFGTQPAGVGAAAGHDATQQFAPDPTAQFSGTQNSAAGSGTTEFGAPYGFDQVPPPQKKSKAPMIVGLSVAGALVLGGGAFGAYKLWFSGAQGSETPVAAAHNAINGLADSDLQAIVGSLSPVESQYSGQLIKVVSEHFEGVEGLEDLQSDTDPQELVDLYELSVEGLELSEEEIVADETTRVRVDEGTFTFDVDIDKTIEIVKESASTLSGLADTFGSVTGESGLQEEFTTEDEAELRSQLEVAFPASLTVEDGVVVATSAAGQQMNPTDETSLSLVTVKEGSDWFVSPLLTIADYALTESGSSERGSIKQARDVKGAGSPEDAGQSFIAALESLITEKTIDPLIDSMPQAERRTIAFIGSAIDKDALAEGLQEAPEVTLSDASFNVRDNSDGVARLELAKLDISVTVSGAQVQATWADGCLTSAVFPETINREALCFDDPELAGLKKLGLDQVSIVAVKEDNGWFVSVPGTVLDAYGTVLAKVYELALSRELTEDWLTENFSGLESLLGNTPGGMTATPELDLDDFSDPFAGDDPQDSAESEPGGDDDGSEDTPDASQSAGALESELESAATALEALLDSSETVVWPMIEDLGEYGYTLPEDVYMYVMDFEASGNYCIGGYTATQMAMETGSLDQSGKYYTDSMTCGQE